MILYIRTRTNNTLTTVGLRTIIDMRRALCGQLRAQRLFNKTTNTAQTRSSVPSSSHTARNLTVAVGAAGISAAIAYDGYRHQFAMFGGALRFARSMRIAAQISLDYGWNLHGLAEDSAEYAERIAAINQRSAERLLAGCLANGGLYVKIGQGIAAINHILPREYTQTLSRLENECWPRSPHEVRAVFAAEFGGRQPEEMFEHFDYAPVAAASLAQVFRARTHDGAEVAVKVQYADLAARFDGDFGTIQVLQAMVRRVHKAYNFSWILDDLRGNLEQELDFVREADNAERCAVDMQRLGGGCVHVPRVHRELSSSRILTAEWIDGYKVTDMERLAADGLGVAEVDRKLFDAFAEQIFGTGFVHADPHPGNVFVRRNQRGNADIVLLDHGLYENLSLGVRRSLCHFWEAIVLRDVAKMQQYAAELGVDDYDKLAEILLQRPVNVNGGGGQSMSHRLSDADLAYMQQMAKQRFDTVLLTLRQMPTQMLFVVRNLNTIRAIARRHGDPLDRPAHMARYAQRCIYRHEKETGSGRWAAVRWFVRRLRFEYHLLRVSLMWWFVRSYVKVVARCAGKSAEVERIMAGDGADPLVV